MVYKIFLQLWVTDADVFNDPNAGLSPEQIAQKHKAEFAQYAQTIAQAEAERERREKTESRDPSSQLA